MSKIVRVYPIRTTRKNWKIPIFGYHKCSESCSVNINIDGNDEIIVQANPSYKNGICSDENNLERSQVRICDFDPDNPFSITGPLYESNVQIIPDSYFKITFTFPLSTTLDVTIRKTPSSYNISQGFILSEVLFLIRKFYEFIYIEEERTSTEQNYQIEKQCPSACYTNNRSEYIMDIENPIENNNCCICYASYCGDNRAVKLRCDHIFHRSCIDRWLNTSTTCPLCRCIVYSCDSCDGSGVIRFSFSGTVIPREERGIVMNRNTTNGIFGIFDFDLEDLTIDDLEYNRVNKVLKMNIGRYYKSYL